MSRRRRELSPDDRELWRRIAETVNPLRGRRPPDAPAEAADGPSPAQPQVPAERPGKMPALSVPKPPPLAGLEPGLRRRLGRGRADVDARLDLHGMRQDAAHRTLNSFLAAEQARGSRVVLVITGKGRTAAGEWRDDAPGVLRRQVPMWLAAPELRAVVIGFDEAAIGHGGAGALYVRLRRGRGT